MQDRVEQHDRPPAAGSAAPATNGSSVEAGASVQDARGLTERANVEPQAPVDEHRWIAAVLRHRHFRRVWTASIFSNTGTFMEHVGVAWIIAATAARPASYLGYLGAAQLIPMMLLGIPGGLLADRVNRKTLLLVTQFLLMLIAASVAVLSAMGLAKPVNLLGLMTLMGVVYAFNVPAWQVLTPRLVPKSELSNAIYMNGLQFNLARVIGPALGGYLMHLWGPTVLFALNTASFVAVLGAVCLTPDAPAPATHETSVWARTKEAIGFVARNPGPRAVLLGMVVYGFLALPFMRLMPMFVRLVYADTRGLNEAGQEKAYGGLLGAMGVGAVVAVGASRLIPRWYPKHHFIPMSILGGGIAIVLFAIAPSYWPGIIASVACGMFWLWSFNSCFAAMQVLVPDAMRGRVLAVCNVATFASMALGPVAAGEIGDALTTADNPGMGVVISVAASGILLTLAGLVMLTFRTPEVDGLKPGDLGYDRKPGLFRGITATAHRPGRFTRPGA